MSSQAISYNFLLVGKSGVGKTSLLKRFLGQEHSPEFVSTIGIDFGYKSVTRKDRTDVSLRIFDTSGQVRFQPITDHYFRQRTNGVMVIFDVSDKSSFMEVENFVDRVRNICPQKEKTAILLVGNKTDLVGKRCISSHQGEEKAADLGCKYVETSASTSFNIKKAFEILVSQVHDQQKEIPFPEKILSASQETTCSFIYRYLSLFFFCALPPP